MRSIKFLFVPCLAVLLLAIGYGQDRDQPKRIAQWGSSVSNGTGDESGSGGYAGRLEQLLEARGWEMFNQSRGGDNTIRITPRFEPDGTPDPETKYLTTVDPSYVVIGLSLGNEGIRQCASGRDTGCRTSEKEADDIYQQFADGLQRLIQRSRDAGITPVVALAYARNDFTEFEYRYTRRMNILINSWNVPSVNLLGAIDDGSGRWARGFFRDPLHPNSAGHTEMFHAFVPTLFDALAAGKPIPTKSTAQRFARVRGNDSAPLTLQVGDTMRSFSLSFMVRAHVDGVVAGVEGETVSDKIDVGTETRPESRWNYEVMTLSPNGSRFRATIARQNGQWLYAGVDGNAVMATARDADGQWRYITLTHYVALGRTHFYVDGRLIGTVNERLQPTRFILGGSGDLSSAETAAQADYKEWMIHRAGLNVDEVAVLHDGGLLQASLELYAPLSDSDFSTPENRAQSLSTISVDPDSVTPMEDP